MEANGKPQDYDTKKEEDDDQINYNTITSLAALKELLHGNASDDSDEDMAWFQHYFLHHVNRLPKQEQRSPYLRPILEGRRLSECREVPELEELEDANGKKEPKRPETVEEVKATTPTPTGTPKRVVSPAPSHRRRHTTAGAGGRESPLLPELPNPNFPPLSPMVFHKISPLPSPHLDKHFFDVSLIEMKSQASSSSTLDYDSTEEVWVMRDESTQTAELVRRKRET
ncbi:uncharacterized protein [Anabrus simplex]|uniref:uncharacterized protein n=1 Tax=Anabrus simplex TaxID=316456 RepID=UPI0035A29C76